MALKRGRKTICTPQLTDTICNLIRLNVPINVACAKLGISERVFFAWVEKGHTRGKKDAAMLHFMQSVEQAKADAEIRCVVTIDKAANGVKAAYDAQGKLISPNIDADWKAAAWLLERKQPERWGKRDALKLFESKQDETFKPEDPHAQLLELIQSCEKDDHL